jgi:hypothetical protein
MKRENEAGMAIGQTRSEVQPRFDPRYSVPGQIGLKSCKNPESTESDRSGVEIRRFGLVWTLDSDRCNVGLGVCSTDVPEKLQEKLQLTGDVELQNPIKPVPVIF